MTPRLSSFILSLWTAVAAFAADWHPDNVLSDGYMTRTVVQPSDYSGRVESTIVRKLVPGDAAAHKAVLYIHGFNDYFFNSEMGDEFVAHGYDFYAVDLRKYGRSLLPGQRPFEVRNLNEYFADIDSALVEIERGGADEIVLMGHSTGGLIAAYYMHCNPGAPVDAMILNSPFLDWNLGWMEWLVPVVSWWGKIAPGTLIPQGDSEAYADSLLKHRHGRWSYNTDWKMPQSPDVTAGWVRAITLAQKDLRGGKADIRIPILLMYSDNSVNGGTWTADHNRGDGVLDVADIARYGRLLGPHVGQMVVKGGLHDLFLSNPRLLANLYPRVFAWLDRHLPPAEAGRNNAQ